MSATNLNVMSDKFDSVQITAPSGGLTAGNLYASNYIVGVVVETAAAAAAAVLIYRCPKINVLKDAGTGITFSIGSKVYYNSSTNKVTNVSSGNTLIGRALEAAGASATDVIIDLDGTKVA